MKDLVSNIGLRASIAPAVITANTNGASVDRKGFESVTHTITTGAIAGSGNFTPKIQDSDDGTNFTDVAAIYRVGTFPAALAASSNYKVGYVGHKRYTRLVLTLNSGTSIAASATAILSHATTRPVA